MMTASETKRRYDRVQRTIAAMAKDRNATIKAGKPWPVNSGSEKKFWELKTELAILEGK